MVPEHRALNEGFSLYRKQIVALEEELKDLKRESFGPRTLSFKRGILSLFRKQIVGLEEEQKDLKMESFGPRTLSFKRGILFI